MTTVAWAQAPVRIFVFTAPAEFVDDASAARTDAMADLVRALRDKPSIVLAPQREEADLVLEVLGRTSEETGGETTTRGGFGLGPSLNTTQDHTTRIQARLTAGTYSTDLVGDAGMRLRRFAASDLAKKVERWVRDNRERIVK